MNLVLSLFPGIGLLDMAFEQEGFCVVRGPDLLWGGDIKRFHPPAGKFEGVIGGPPCQAHSTLRYFVAHMHRKHPEKYHPSPDLIPEFERVIAESHPAWFVMENVPRAPMPSVPGYLIRDVLVRDVWVGGLTTRLRRFSFGTADGRKLSVEVVALQSTAEPLPAVLASGGHWVPIKIGGNGQVKRTHHNVRAGRLYGEKTTSYFRQSVVAQGLPANFDIPPFTVAAKIHAIGNGVPLPMGLAIAKAVKRAIA